MSILTKINLNGTQYSLCGNDVVKVDFAEGIQVDDALYQSWIDAYERGALFYSMADEPLSVFTVIGDYSTFEFLMEYTYAETILAVERSGKEGYYSYDVQFNEYYDYYVIDFEHLSSDSFTDYDWQKLNKACGEERPFFIGNSNKTLIPAQVSFTTFTGGSYFHIFWIDVSLEMGDYYIRREGEEGNYTYTVNGGMSDSYLTTEQSVENYYSQIFETLAPVATSGSYNDLLDQPDLQTVAFTGSYNDLTDVPTIPEGVVVDAALSDVSENAVQNKVVKGAIDAAKAHYIDFETLLTQGITDDVWDAMVAAINAKKPIITKVSGIYYTIDSVVNSNNQIILTACDNVANYIYTFIKNGSNDYSYNVETKGFVSQTDRTNWDGKADASSVYTKTEVDNKIGNIATVLASI